MAATDFSRRSGVRAALTAACGLLGVGGGTARATEVNSALLAYTEPGRVSAVEGIVDGKHVLADGKALNFHFVFDTLTGASANGATPASFIQTFTRPSGQGPYRAARGETPLDDTFKDTRGAVSGGITLPLNRLTNVSAGLYGSGEHDYTSLGANTALTRDFNQRNTTLSLRAAYFHDTVSPEGGRPIPFASMQPPGTVQPRLSGNGTKNTLDATLGLTQVLSRSTLFSANYTHSRVRDYQTDPYKLLSVVDPLTGDPVDYVYEGRPDARDKDVVFATVAHHFSRDILHLSYRYYTDDWGITSHTVDLTYRLKFRPGQYLQPHARYYHQTRADFYRRFLVDGVPLPATASADYRLGDMEGTTVGLKYGRKLKSGGELTFRAEYYLQTFSGKGTTPLGGMSAFDLFPSIDAYIFQVGYAVEIGNP